MVNPCMLAALTGLLQLASAELVLPGAYSRASMQSINAWVPLHNFKLTAGMLLLLQMGRRRQMTTRQRRRRKKMQMVRRGRRQQPQRRRRRRRKRRSSHSRSRAGCGAGGIEWGSGGQRPAHV